MKMNQHFGITQGITAFGTIPPFVRQTIKREINKPTVELDPLLNLIQESAPSQEIKSPFLFDIQSGTLNIIPPSLRLLKELGSFPEFVPQERNRLTRLEKDFNRIRVAQQREVYYTLSEEEAFIIKFALEEIQYQFFLSHRNTYFSRQFFELMSSNNTITSQFNQDIKILRIYFNLNIYSHLNYISRVDTINQQLYDLLYSPPRDQEAIYNQLHDKMFDQFRQSELLAKLTLQQRNKMTIKSQDLNKKTIARGKLYYQPRIQKIIKEYPCTGKKKAMSFKTPSTIVTNANTGKILYHADLIFEKKKTEKEIAIWSGTRQLKHRQNASPKEKVLSDHSDELETISTADTVAPDRMHKDIEKDERTLNDGLPQEDNINATKVEITKELNIEETINRYLLGQNIFPQDFSVEEYVKVKMEQQRKKKKSFSRIQERRLLKFKNQKFPTIEVKERYEELTELIDGIDVGKDIDPELVSLLKDSSSLPFSYITQLKKPRQLEGIILSQGQSFIDKWMKFNYLVVRQIRRSRTFSCFKFEEAYNLIKLNKIQQLIFKLQKKIFKKIGQLDEELAKEQQKHNEHEEKTPLNEEKDELLDLLLGDLQNMKSYRKEIQQNKFATPHQELIIIQGNELYQNKQGKMMKLQHEEISNYRKRINDEF